MKSQFKYLFRSALRTRGIVFAIILAMDIVFIALAELDVLPIEARITAVALSGVAVVVMLICNLVDDVGIFGIIRRTFIAPSAYLQGLTPTPRRKTLFANVISMMVMDNVTMAGAIIGVSWLSLNLAYFRLSPAISFGVTVGSADGPTAIFLGGSADSPMILIMIWSILLFIAGYLLIMMLILFCVTAKKSIFYGKRAPMLMTLLLGCGCLYAIGLLDIIMAPFGVVQWEAGFFVNVSLDLSAMPFYALLQLCKAAGLFILTSKLMERKMNI